ncbi:MAG: response regulator transcription factor [candidate division Zixibacteria bacterium]|nr:response regulator transcription factor [candidate division Zixibacteria bacterium]
MKILIAEDDPVSRMLLEETLNGWGHDVTVADDGKSALKEYQDDKSIKLAILDWMMPGMSGVDACKEMRQHDDRPYTYVIMLTAISQKEGITFAFENGADDYVTKPFTPIELQARVSAGERIVNLQASLTTKINELEDALAQVKQLQGIVPICAWCKKIRDDSDYWSSVEEYMTAHSEAKFSHSICPECMAKHYPEDVPTE